MSAPPTVSRDAPVPLDFTLRNTSANTYRILTTFTPLAGITNDYLLLRGPDGKLLRVRVLADPDLLTAAPPSAYVTLAPGESLIRTMDLRGQYDLKAPGAYTVDYPGDVRDLVIDEPARERRPAEFRRAVLSCNRVAFQVKGD